jgi:hypothetical protein
LEVLHKIADVFQVVVRGFNRELWVCPDLGPEVRGRPPTIDRGFTSLDNKCEGKQRGFRHLQPDVEVRPKKPKPDVTGVPK